MKVPGRRSGPATDRQTQAPANRTARNMAFRQQLLQLQLPDREPKGHTAGQTFHLEGVGGWAGAQNRLGAKGWSGTQGVG